MGFWLYRKHLSRREFEGDAQEEVFDLPKKGILSNLLVYVQAAPGSQNNDIYFADAISKIEVIGNGSAVIQSLDGRQIQASMAFDDKKMPPDVEIADGWGYGHFDMRFGRFVGDELYALDAGAWESLELKITYDFAAGGTIDTTGFKSAGKYLRVVGMYAPDGGGLAPVGFIRKEEKKTFTASVGGSLDLDLPTDYPYRRLMLFTETHANGISNAFYRTTINVNEGARKPFDRIWADDLLALAAALGYTNYITHKRYWLSNAAWTRIHRPLGWFLGVNHQPLAGGDYANGCPTQIDPHQISIPQQPGSANHHFDIWGQAPWGAHVIDFEAMSGGKHGREAMEAILNATERDDIDLEVEENDTSACSVVLEQYATSPP